MALKFITATAIFVLSGLSLHASSSTGPRPILMIGESIVLAGTEPGRLAFPLITTRPMEVRSTYLPGLPNTVRYERGLDYQIDTNGQLTRLPKSRIPDYQLHPTFGLNTFDHYKIPNSGNLPFVVYVDYFYADGNNSRLKPRAVGLEALASVQAKLKAGKSVKIVAFGDSVTAGGEASLPSLIYWERWSQQLRDKYSRANIQTVRSGREGDLTEDGLKRIEADVIEQHPDLVLIAFGLNDYNKGPPEINMSKWELRRAKWARSWAKLRQQPPPEQQNGIGRVDYFANNLREMIDRVKSKTGADVILLSALQPNPKWKFSDGDMSRFAAITESVAIEKACTYVDVFGAWNEYSKRKKPEDLLANNVNHPNDFGHWIYFQALAALAL